MARIARKAGGALPMVNSSILYNSFCVDSKIAYPNCINPHPRKAFKTKFHFLIILKMKIGTILATTPNEPPIAHEISFTCSGNGLQSNFTLVNTQGQKISPPVAQQTTPCPSSCAIPVRYHKNGYNRTIEIIKPVRNLAILSFCNSLKFFIIRSFDYVINTINEPRLDTDNKLEREP
jgi:hypothetical protein